MKRTFVGILFLLPFLSISQCPYNNLAGYSIGASATTFVQGSGALSFYAEAAPWVIKGGWYQYYFTTHYTGVWSAPRSLATPYNETVVVSNSTGYGPKWNCAAGDWWGSFVDPNYLESDGYIYHNEWKTYHWRRNYNGIFTAQVVFHQGSNQNILLAFSHGENKNEVQDNNKFYQNTVRPNFKIDPNNHATFSGSYNGGPYEECWDAYFAFLNGNWLPYDAANDYGANYLNDLGPIAWPSAGYVNAQGNPTSSGLRHPSSIIDGDYVYIFVADASNDGTGGFKVIRVLKNNILIPTSYETWSSVSGWIPSLPAGFSKDIAASYFATRGPQNTAIFPLDASIVRFSVAKFKNTNKFIGLECYIGDNGNPRLAFRTSTDLVHWSDRIVFYCEGGDWGNLQLKYPIFLSKDGISNNDIDEDDFYVIGTSSNNSITKLHFVKDPSYPSPFRMDTKINAAANGTMNQEAVSAVRAYPNPTQKIVNITGQFDQNGYYTISLFNSTGQMIRTIDRGNKVKGSFTYELSTTSLANGIYYVVVSNNSKPVSKVSIVKQ